MLFSIAAAHGSQRNFFRFRNRIPSIRVMELEALAAETGNLGHTKLVC